MAEESESVLQKAVIWMQQQQECLKDGFEVTLDDHEYLFVPDYIDRLVNKFLIEAGLWNS